MNRIPRGNGFDEEPNGYPYSSKLPNITPEMSRMERHFHLWDVMQNAVAEIIVESDIRTHVLNMLTEWNQGNSPKYSRKKLAAAVDWMFTID